MQDSGHFMSTRLFHALCFFALAVVSSGVAGSESKPNIVFFLADDLGWTGLRCFGSDFYETPNLDRLAEEGIKFTDAYAACTVCSPTRASILTGKYPARLRLTSFIPGQERPFAKLTIPDWTKGLQASETTLPEVLQANGYKTLHVGKWHLDFPNRPDAGPTSHGFDFSADKPKGTKGFYLSEKTQKELGTESGYLTDYLADLAVAKIEENKAGPFFLYFAFHVPHTPIQGREDLVAEFSAKVDPEAVHRNPTYAAMVKSMDLAVGRVIAALEDNGLADNTLIVFTSDHGDMMQSQGLGTKLFPFDESIRVPFLFHYPRLQKGEAFTLDVPIDAPDIMPTLLGLVGLPIPSSVEGSDWSPFIRGEKESTGTEAGLLNIPIEFAEIVRNKMKAYRGLRTARYTYVRDSAGPWLLFDNEVDPYQMRNLSGRPEAQSLQESL